MDLANSIMAEQGVATTMIRAADLDVPPGVHPDMTEHGWATAGWSKVQEQVMAADILVIGRPTRPGTAGRLEGSSTVTPHLVYFADPMCSWCWGFAPTLARLRETFGADLPVRLIMGGLRPGVASAMTDAAKHEVRTHWEHVRDASGQPFDFGFFDRQSFVYDTDPAARAVVAMRRSDPEAALDFFTRVQKAFYADGRDVTSAAVLGDVAAEAGADREGFLADLASDAVTEETWRDYATSQRTGVRGFPTLAVGPNADGAHVWVTQGYQPAETLLGPLQAWLRASRVPA